jgi:hypothetical protein
VEDLERREHRAVGHQPPKGELLIKVIDLLGMLLLAFVELAPRPQARG